MTLKDVRDYVASLGIADRVYMGMGYTTTGSSILTGFPLVALSWNLMGQNMRPFWFTGINLPERQKKPPGSCLKPSVKPGM